MKRSEKPISRKSSESLSQRFSSQRVSTLTKKGSNNGKQRLTRAYPKLTETPRMSLADFKVLSTAYGLEIHFSQRRIPDSLLASVSKRKVIKRKQSNKGLPENTGFVLLTLLSTVVFVGGSVALTGSILLGVIIAAVLPGLWWLITPSQKPKRYGNAILRVSGTPTGRTLMTLKTLPPAQQKRSSQYIKRLPSKSLSTSIALKSTVLCANLPIKVIKKSRSHFLSHFLSPRGFLSAHQISFVFEADNRLKGSEQLCIKGTPQEIQWLYAHLCAQGDIPTEK